ncbi:Alkylhydroperoxidase AhpD [Candidatus Koribacter versatilis Ellin345]|uniref:Alkylhydroperoxidase AhpD n=1 Tax=Koribacter versatilis (strain Ellin345) TaxID=204669 RepID=Q1IKT6_KORVE|nr:carboxymuconolactone decarboxylase family protein [Candidatus Koribacter versatilis]ABF42514.1 Alkylhydroperoxidase AhpD [Candidatus Koribacter versatilis Ellin345]
MKSRMTNPALILPEAMQALRTISTLIEKAGVPVTTLQLIELRVSQINGCSVCLEMHAFVAKKAGETDTRLVALAGWRDAPYYSDAERAALALAEHVTRLSDRSDPVPDTVWNEAVRHYDEKGLSALLLAITSINTWNRLNVATRQVAGEWMKFPEAVKMLEEYAVAK